MAKTEYEKLEEQILKYAFSNEDNSRKKFNEWCIKYLKANKNQLQLMYKQGYLYVNSWGIVLPTRKGMDRFYRLRGME